jgi:hypothetical protein
MRLIANCAARKCISQLRFELDSNKKMYPIEMADISPFFSLTWPSSGFLYIQAAQKTSVAILWDLKFNNDIALTEITYIKARGPRQQV